MKKRTVVYVVCLCLLIAAAAGLGIFLQRCAADAGANVSGEIEFPVRINEIMASNGSYYDDRGNAYDWIELHNSGDIVMNLTGYKLTDTERNVRYIFPAGAEIQPDGYYVVWCKRNEASGDYADFSISKAGRETIVLMNSHSVTVDRVVTLPLGQDEVMARDDSGQWTTLSFGTPGYDNTEAGLAAYAAGNRAGGASVRINELMSANRSYCDPRGVSSDWIELYNAGESAADISGYRLSDRADAAGYRFAEGTVMEPGAYLLIWCDSGVTDAAYAHFSLSSAGGESVALTTGAGKVLDQIVTPAMAADISLARAEDGAWNACDAPTPGYENSDAGRRAYLEGAVRANADIVVTEIMAANRSCIQDAAGEFSDWIELANLGDTPTSLKGYSLSDNPENPTKYLLPDVELAPGERTIVFCSGKQTVIDGEIHSSFSLNRHQGTVTLCAPSGQMLSSVSYSELPENHSWRRGETDGAWADTPFATPGYPNDDAGYTRFMDAAATGATLVISEVMPGNGTLLEQGNGLYFDWIELENRSGASLNISGWSLTDNLDKIERTALPDKTLAPGERIMLLCTGNTLRRCAYAQIDMTLAAAGENLFLLDEGGEVADYIWLHDIPYEGSCGRMPAESGQFYFAVPTPGNANRNGSRLISAEPAASVASGVYTIAAPMELSLSAPGTIYYTLDGTLPTPGAHAYTGPLTVSRTTVVRAVAVESGKLMSGIATYHYIVNEGHTLPVVSVVTDEKYLFDSRLGIFAGRNIFDRTVERPANIAYFNGEETFLTDCGLKLHGAGTRERQEKKSFKITFRARYGGTAPLEFPLFEDNDITTFYSILLRNGQDYSRAYVRDELVSWFAYRQCGELCVQDTRFCVMYLNGGYYGIYCIKEAFSSGYFSTHYGVSKDSVEIQRGYVKDDTEFKRLMDYARNHRLDKDAEAYGYVADRVNLESLIDWCVLEGYTGNRDISVNARYIRSTEYDDNRWHYALFDTDFGFDDPATFQYAFGDVNHGVIPGALIRNKEFQDMFLKRMAYLLTNHITREAILERYHMLIAEIEGEIPRESARWHVRKPLNWTGHQEKLMKYLEEDRTQVLKEEIAQIMRRPLSDVEAYFAEAAREKARER